MLGVLALAKGPCSTSHASIFQLARYLQIEVDRSTNRSETMLWKNRRVNQRARLQSASKPMIEALESRLVLTVLFVNSLSDAPVNLNDNTVTLRDAWAKIEKGMNAKA